MRRMLAVGLLISVSLAGCSAGSKAHAKTSPTASAKAISSRPDCEQGRQAYDDYLLFVERLISQKATPEELIQLLDPVKSHLHAAIADADAAHRKAVESADQTAAQLHTTLAKSPGDGGPLAIQLRQQINDLFMDCPPQ